MKARSRVSIALVAALAISSVAQAGTLPSPFTNGRVPSAKDILKIEAGLSKDISKVISDGAKCYQKAMQNLQAGKSDGISTCLGTLNSGLAGVPIGALGKISFKLATPLIAALTDPANSIFPQCIAVKDTNIPNDTAFTDVFGALTGLLPKLLGVAFCAGDPVDEATLTSICDDAVGLQGCTDDSQCQPGYLQALLGNLAAPKEACNAGTCALDPTKSCVTVDDCYKACSRSSFGATAKVSMDKAIVKTEVASIGIALKFALAATKCLDKEVANQFKMFGTAPATAQTCIATARAKAVADANKLALKSLNTPACLFDQGTFCMDDDDQKACTTDGECTAGKCGKKFDFALDTLQNTATAILDVLYCEGDA